jgi:hypothetical protein
MARSETIRNLKNLLAEKEAPQGAKKEFYISSTLSVGIPRGSLVELTGNAKAEWLASFLKENKNLRVFWCEEEQTIFPTAISQRGINLNRIVFGILKDSLFSSLRKIIQSQVFEVVISPSSFTETKLLKALQLFSEKANTTLFLLAKKHQSAWPISVQLEINLSHDKKIKVFEINVQKNRYESLGCG